MLSALSYLYTHLLTIIVDGLLALGCAGAFGFIMGAFMGGIYDIKKRYRSDTNNDETPALIFSALGTAIVAFIATIWMINVNDSLGTVVSEQICNAVIGIVIAFVVYRLYARSKRNAEANSHASTKRRPF